MLSCAWQRRLDSNIYYIVVVELISADDQQCDNLSNNPSCCYHDVICYSITVQRSVEKKTPNIELYIDGGVQSEIF